MITRQAPLPTAFAGQYTPRDPPGIRVVPPSQVQAWKKRARNQPFITPFCPANHRRIAECEIPRLANLPPKSRVIKTIFLI